MLHAILNENTKLCSAYMKEVGQPLEAVNLCSTYRNKVVDSITMTDQLFEEVVKKLINSEGNAINHYLA
jgi:hypothetical protein